MSPMPRTTVDDDAHRQAAQAIEETVNSCDRIYQQAMNSIDTLQASWQGGAGNTFRGAVHAWSEQYDSLRRSMHAFAEALSKTRSSMTQAELDGHQGANSFFARVNP